MAGRMLYVIAYDISEDRRLNRVRTFLKGYSTGGQKSVYECFLTNLELNRIVEELQYMIDENQDRIHIFQLDRRAKIIPLGIALMPKDPSYFFIG
ncbi:MAG: CRISPR-associated endonuclease Cas2 [Methanothermobacter tenebrarum]